MRGSWTLSCSIGHASSTELTAQFSARANEVPSSLRRLEIQDPSHTANGTLVLGKLDAVRLGTEVLVKTLPCPPATVADVQKDYLVACFETAQARASRPLPNAEVTAKLTYLPVFDAHRAGVCGLRDFLLQA